MRVYVCVLKPDLRHAVVYVIVCVRLSVVVCVFECHYV